jgi:glucose-6-phosphate 1-dehydrogenase
MDFNYHHNYEGPVLDSYGKVLLDCMIGDQMLFWRQDGVELCWGFLTPILSECEACADREQMLHFYEAGSWGPQPARKLIEEVVRAFDGGTQSGTRQDRSSSRHRPKAPDA